MIEENRLGLIFTGGEGPLVDQILCIMGEAQILPGNRPVLVAADSGLLLAEKAGLTVDWIIGDMDSLPAEEKGSGVCSQHRLAAYPAEKILKFPEDKDFTDTELAFALLREKNCKRIWIIGGGGGRLDQLFGLRSLFERDDPPERWVTAADDIHCLEAPPLQGCKVSGFFIPSELLVSSAHKTPLFPVSVFPLGTGPWEAESTGLKWSLSGLSWHRDFIAISNQAPEGNFSIRAIRGRFLTLMPFFPEQARLAGHSS